MASFTDKISQFNPYIQQLPAQEMQQVGMYKQQQYDQGVQKIQGYIDNIAGMDVMNDVDKQYVQSKLNDLGGKLKTVAAGDFSNHQLVNSVGGMATSIIKDPTIQNAVSSTAFYRRENGKMQKAIDDGKSNPANETKFQKAANKYLSATTAGEKFGTSYTQFFDVDKFTKEMFDSIKPGGYTHDQVFETNADGSTKYEQIPVKDEKTGKVTYHQGAAIYSPVMVRLKKEGRLPQEVQGTIDQIMADPRVGQQLQITGEYNYGGIDSNGLVAALDGQKQSKLAIYNDKLAQLNLNKKLGKDVQSDIDFVQGNINTLTSNYDQLAQMAIKNPDAIRGYLHKEKVKQDYTVMYGSTRVSEEDMANPGWQANYEILKEANANSRWAQDLAWKKKQFQLEKEFTSGENKLNRENALLIASMRGKGGKGGITAPGYGANEGVTLDENSSALSVTGEYERLKNEKTQDFLNSSYGFIYNSMFAGTPANDNAIQNMVNRGVPKEKAIETLLNNQAKANGESIESYITRWGQKATTEINKNLGTAPPSVIDGYNKFKRTSKEYINVINEGKDIDKQVSKLYGIDIPEKIKGMNIQDMNVTFRGQPYKLTKEDLYDAAVYLAGHKSAVGFLGNDAQRLAAKEAEGRLQARGKDFLLSTVLDKYGNSVTNEHGVITAASRVGKSLGNTLMEGFTGGQYIMDANGHPIDPLLHTSTSDAFSNGITKMFNLVNDEKITNALTKRAELLRSTGLIRPNIKLDVLSGNAEDDRDTYNKLTTIAGNYVANNKNLSPIGDVKNFLSGISKKDPDKVEAKVITGVNGQSVVQMVSYDASGKSGAMTIALDEAKNLGVNVGAINEPEQIVDVRRLIANNPNRRTSHSDPNDLLTYTQGDAYFEKTDFPKMINTKPGQDMKANIKYQNGLWYGVVYAKDADGKVGLQETQGQTDLNATVQALRNIGPESIPIITKK